MMSGFGLPFFTVSTAVVVLPTGRLLPPTLRVAGTVIVVASTPVPESATVCGLPAAFEAIDRDAVLAPAAFALNWIDTVQVPAGAMLAPEHVSPDFVKSAAFVPPIEAPPAEIR